MDAWPPRVRVPDSTFMYLKHSEVEQMGSWSWEQRKAYLQGGQSKETVAQLLPTRSSWEGFRRAILKARLGGGGWGGAGYQWLALLWYSLNPLFCERAKLHFRLLGYSL